MLHEQGLPATLEVFERSLEAPIIPGELQTWSANAQATCHDAVAALKEHVSTWHKRVLEDIKRQDADLLPRVQELHSQDAELLSQARRVKAVANTLAELAEVFTLNEPTIKREVEKVIGEGLDWIIRARKQEAALTTWYQEAFNRRDLANR